MNFLRRRALFSGIAAFVVLFVVSGVMSPIHAVTTTTLNRLGSVSNYPRISTDKVKENSVAFTLTYLPLKSTKVTIKVQVTNADNGDDPMTKTVVLTLGKDGTGTVKIDGLDASTNYGVKLRLKKSSGASYSAYSNNVLVTTEGSDYKPTIDAINDTTKNSAKLEISCEDLSDKTVNVRVAFLKKTTWSTRDFRVELDGDGQGDFTVDGLKSNTKYNFKIRVKKSDDTTYSVFSPIKSATTDKR